MKTDNLQIHLPEDPCLTENELHDYISGKASRDIQYRVEMHTLDCAMCADALEGYEEKVKRGVVIPVAVKGKVIPLFGNKKAVYSAVAGVAIVIGAFFLLRITDSKQEVQLAEAPRNYAADSFKQGPIPADIALEEKPNTTVQEQEERNPLNETRITEIGGSKTTTIDDPPRTQEETYNAAPPTVSAADDGASVLDEAAGNYSGDADGNLGAAAEKDKKESTVVTQQTSGTKAAEQEDAIVVMQQAPASNSTVPQVEAKNDKNQSRAEGPHPNKPNSRDLDIAYEKGVEFMGKKNYAGAIAFFNQVLIDRQHRYYDDAKWNKAVCLIENGKKEEARVILREIEQSNSKYNKEATERLKTL